MDHTRIEDEVRALRADTDALRAALATHTAGNRRRVRSVAWTAGLVALLVAGTSAADHGVLYVFAPGSPALASEVNHNFAQLESWLAQKVGPVGNDNLTITGDNDNQSNISGSVGNFHIDTTSGGQMYLNWYGGTKVVVGNGSQGSNTADEDANDNGYLDHSRAGQQAREPEA